VTREDDLLACARDLVAAVREHGERVPNVVRQYAAELDVLLDDAPRIGDVYRTTMTGEEWEVTIIRLRYELMGKSLTRPGRIGVIYPEDARLIRRGGPQS
jgi:hypothetical protein